MLGVVFCLATAVLAPLAYQDTLLPISFDKTISQPFIVALMTDLLGPEPHESILEVGTGLGYQAAVLAELSGRVWSVEIVEELAGQAEANLRQLGCSDVAIPRAFLARTAGFGFDTI